MERESLSPPIPNRGIDDFRSMILPVGFEWQSTIILKFWSMALSPSKHIFTGPLLRMNMGVAYGAVHRFKTKAIPTYPYWADAQPIQDAEGWWNSPWFGSFFINDDHRWILHAKWGWVICASTGTKEFGCGMTVSVGCGRSKQFIHLFILLNMDGYFFTVETPRTCCFIHSCKSDGYRFRRFNNVVFKDRGSE